MLTVVLALPAALSNASASVLQRRAASEEPKGGKGLRQAARWLGHVLRRPHWLMGAGLLALSTVLQAAALGVGSLSLVQPLLAAELLFTLLLGSVVFHRRPDPRTWPAFAPLAAGLAMFLTAPAPTAGRPPAVYFQRQGPPTRRRYGPPARHGPDVGPRLLAGRTRCPARHRVRLRRRGPADRPARRTRNDDHPSAAWVSALTPGAVPPGRTAPVPCPPVRSPSAGTAHAAAGHPANQRP